jgi:predicted phage tail protein
MNTYVWVFSVFFASTLVVLAIGWAIIEAFGIANILILLGASVIVGTVAVIIEWITERSRA